MGCAASASRTASSGSTMSLPAPEPAPAPAPKRPPPGLPTDEWHYDVLDYFARRSLKFIDSDSVRTVDNPLRNPMYPAWTNGKIVNVHTRYESQFKMSPHTYDCLASMEKYLLDNHPESASDEFYYILDYNREPVIILVCSSSDAGNIFPYSNIWKVPVFGISKSACGKTVGYCYSLEEVLQTYFGLTTQPTSPPAPDLGTQFRLGKFPNGKISGFKITLLDHSYRGQHHRYPCRENTPESVHDTLFTPLPNPARERFLEALPHSNKLRKITKTVTHNGTALYNIRFFSAQVYKGQVRRDTREHPLELQRESKSSIEADGS
jgi:hypothetical protein